MEHLRQILASLRWPLYKQKEYATIIYSNGLPNPVAIPD